MSIVFFIKSASVDLSKYTIKDLPGSSGRLDVTVRCILAALLNNVGFEKDIQIWVFLDKYGAYIFNSELLDYGTFPKNELSLADCFADLIRGKNLDNNSLKAVKTLQISIFDALHQFQGLGYKIFVLKEKCKDFFRYTKESHMEKDILFVIGSQSGEFIESKELRSLNFPSLSLGSQSYLGSSVIRLIKMSLLNLI